MAGILGHKVKVPIVALGGDQGLGRKVGEMVNAIAKNVEQYVIPNCGHFVPEECPDEVVRHVLTMTNKVRQTATSPSIGLRP